jgi:hypothetical protein
LDNLEKATKKEGYDAKNTGNRFQGEKNLRANYGLQVV